jgi:hypothetical protein
VKVGKISNVDKEFEHLDVIFYLYVLRTILISSLTTNNDKFAVQQCSRGDIGTHLYFIASGLMSELSAELGLPLMIIAIYRSPQY